MSKKNAPVFVSPVAVAAYAWLARPDEGQQYSDGKYKVTLVFDPKDEDTKSFIKQIKEASVALAKEELGVKTPKLPLRDGNTMKNEEFAGKILITAKSKFQPGFVDSAKKPLPEETFPQSGDMVRCSFALSAYPGQGGGVAAQLRNVMLVEKRNTGGSPTRDFDDVEVPEGADTSDEEDFDIAI